jgi:hypothetical protein
VPPFECPRSETDCFGVCVDLTSDEANCGACGNSCGVGQECLAGECRVACPAGETNCSEVCVDLTINEANCGACGHSCSVNETCVDGGCVLDCGADTPCAYIQDGQLALDCCTPGEECSADLGCIP